MRTKSSKSATDPQSTTKTIDRLIADFACEFPVAPTAGPYEGPPFGLLRELDFVTLSPDRRLLVQALGRHLWQSFQRVRHELLRWVESPRPSLDAVVGAVAAELAFTVKALEAACALEASAPAANRALLEASLIGVERINALAQALEAQVRLEKVPQP